MKKLYTQITKIGAKENKTLPDKVIKLGEEVGELCGEVLKLRGKKGSKGKSKSEVKQEAIDELADVYIRAMVVSGELGVSWEKLKEAIERKTEKFADNTEKQNDW